jgi:hypothetical protein
MYLTWQEVHALAPVSDDHFLALVAALSDLEDVDEAIKGVDVSGKDDRLDVQLWIEADNLEAALTHAVAALRTALHASGGATPGWETGALHVTSKDKAAELADRLTRA